MLRWVLSLVCLAGWVVVTAGVAAPLGGMVWAAAQGGRISTEVVAVPAAGVLLARSVALAAVATAGAVLLGLPPAAVLANLGWCRRRARQRAVAATTWGLVLAPLLIPPQVYAYAWGLWPVPNRLTPTLRAGLISAAWLWPVVAMVVASGWRSTGRGVQMLASLDASPGRAFLRAVLPSLRAHLIAGASIVFALSLIEYAIPHLALSRVFATELLVLVDVGAPPGQIMRMAGQVMLLIFLLGLVVAWSLRGLASWDSAAADEEGETPGPAGRLSPLVLAGAVGVWMVSVALPAMVMWRNLRVHGAWTQGLTLFGREWWTSLGVAGGAAVLAVITGIGTAVLGAAWGRRDPRILPARLAAMLALAGAVVPAGALATGLIVVFNRAGPLGRLYTQTPVIWMLALTARYAAIVVVVAWLALRKRGLLAAEQARTDGAGRLEVVAAVLLPTVWPSLLAGGLIVGLLSLFEVVATQMVRPVGYPSIALALLGQMHYGRDDVVITSSLLILAAGVLITQACAWLIIGRR